MLPLQQAYEAKASVLEYLKATFGFRDKDVNRAFEKFIEDENEGIFKGPYISLKLPFSKTNKDAIKEYLSIYPDFDPFVHQAEAFKRLTTQNSSPSPTLLTTGTGSGKTESFIYPLLDYCYENRRRRGIKAIILYPMNALATDQAQRLANTIYNDTRLKDNVTAGLLIGMGTNRKDYPTYMDKDHIIENRETIIQYPPDILLTNFKMLDYALMRHNFYPLWGYNLKDTLLIKFLVLDELHTYDGAQGTDVANLIRRLKLKLKISSKQICPVGTSATLGTGKDSKKLLAKYASDIFGEKIEEDAIIEEQRISTDEFLNIDTAENFLPRGAAINEAQLSINENYDNYIKKQKRLWQINENVSDIQLSDELLSFGLIKEIADHTKNKVLHIQELRKKIESNDENFRKYSINDQLNLLESILALLSQAKTQNENKIFPLVNIQIQYWVRELSGILRKVSDTPEFIFRSDYVNAKEAALPAWFCRECGASGWVSSLDERNLKLDTDIQKIYTKYFSNDSHIFLVNTLKPDNIKIEEYQPTDSLETTPWLNVENLKLNEKQKTDSHIKIIGYKKIYNNKSQYDCPNCNTSNTVSIIGTRTATLASVTTSQVLSSDLDPTKDENRKILSFSNGVQDAAHKAGFIQSRNYRFTFRTALQKIINQQRDEITLPDLHKAFVNYWKQISSNHSSSKPEAYYNQFFPSDHLDIAISYTKKFEEEFDRRILWQITSEFGYNAIIGRTLEKTGSSGAAFPLDKLNKTYDDIKSWLDTNGLHHIDKEMFIKFLNAFLHRLRRRGGVDHPYLEKFRTHSSSPYEITQKVNPQYFLIKNFGRQTRLPKLLSDVNLSVYDSVIRKKALIWSHEYFTKSFPMAQDQTELVNDFYLELLERLQQNDILSKKETSKANNYALNPNVIYVSNQATLFECDTCGHRLTTTQSAIDILESTNCINYRCTGKYHKIQTEKEFDYYRQVYNRERTPRIYAADHTGLLERRKREKIEKSFKKRQNFKDYNVLVATSTLEMGIDIGDLNIAINMDVPPQASNYLQRVGRAGRKSGNALIINFSGNEAHDLYYFQEPKEMMEGDISTPGCYLEAIDILKRHFFAFCLDSWTAENQGSNRIPHTINTLRLNSLNLNDPDFFGNRLVNYIKQNKSNLLNAFKNQYLDEVSPEIFAQLEKNFSSSEAFLQRFLKEFQYLKDENASFKDRITEINSYIKNKNLGNNDPEHLELQNVKRALSYSQIALKRRLLLEHLTNQGFLPNYAFPETGVQLNAIVNRKHKIDINNPKSMAKSNLALELVRSGRTAIKELTPGNFFYTQGYRLEVTGINIKDPNHEIRKYRFCSNCDAIMDISEAPSGNCPKCGDPSWQSKSNVHEFAHLSAVKSFNYEKDARIDDSDETRKDIIPRISRHFQFNLRSSKGAHVSDEIPFGIEYFDSVFLREMNLGLYDSYLSHSTSVRIKGEETPRAGYITCRFCGKSTTSTLYKGNEKKAQDFHFPYCNKKDRKYDGQPDDVFRELYLYRKLNTEAIKVLLPTHDFQTESQIAMFKAGINLGLKEYYKGNPQHIEIVDYAEFNNRTNRQEYFLVLYDSIPGGTGYLSKLFLEPKEFSKVIELAHDRIENCTCQQQGKDGCYRCIYSYSNQYERENLSRKEAEKIFNRISQNIQQWSYQKEGLTEIKDFGKLEESELEDRFVAILRDYAHSNNYDFETIKSDGTYYQFRIEKNDTKLEYEIRPQVALGVNDNIPQYTRPDFIIYSINSSDFRRIAVYLDGYSYHASEENNHFKNDIIKRESIVDSQEYYVWVLTWDDLNRFEEENEDELQKSFNGFKHYKKLSRYPLAKNYDTSVESAKNNFEKLLWLLFKPKAKLESISKMFLTSAQSTLGNYLLSPEQEEEFCKDKSKSIESYHNNKDKNSRYYLDSLNVDTNCDIRLFSQIQDLKISGCIKIHEKDTGDVSYINKESWEHFWQLFNVLQFNINNINIEYNDDLIVSKVIGSSKSDSEAVLDNFDTVYHELIKELLEKQINFNKEDYFTLEEDGVITAEAELGLPDYKLIVEPLDEQSKQEFEKQRFKIRTIDEIKSELKNL